MSYRRIIFFFIFIPNFIFGQGSGHTLNFNGVNEAVNLGDLVANNCRTIEMWFKSHENINSSTSPIALIARDFDTGPVYLKRNLSPGDRIDLGGFAPDRLGRSAMKVLSIY